MNNHVNKQIIEVLKSQKQVFGDELFQRFEFVKKTENDSENKEELITPDKIHYMKENKNEQLNVTNEAFQTSSTLSELESLINACQKCSLGKTRNKFVFGSGNDNADIMVIGEAPGAEEDKQGLPFVGRAGKLLTDILKAIEIDREQIYVANILKCRPPSNRNPLPEEMNLCIPYLYKQIELIKPKMILLLGLVAASGLLKLKTSLTKMRGNVYDIEGVKTMVTYHPAALLRNPHWKRNTWEDVQKFKKIYMELTTTK